MRMLLINPKAPTKLTTDQTAALLVSLFNAP